MTSTALIILSAGKGTRMKSNLPKVLHPVAGAPLVVHAMKAGAELNPEAVIVVAGHEAAQVEKTVTDFAPSTRIVLQTEQLGTAHAVDQTRSALTDFDGDVIILYGDTPFIRPDSLRDMLQARRAGSDIVVLGFKTDQPGKYGRLVTEEGKLNRIVEAKDATPQELEIQLCNSGVICADRAQLFDLLAQVGNDNAQGEYYLTDIVGLANDAGLHSVAVICTEQETLGINSRLELARAEAIWQDQRRAQAMTDGATLTAPETVYFAHDTQLGRDVTVEPHVVFGPGVRAADGVTLRAFSHLEGCVVESGAVVGPYARLRPGTQIGARAKIGNFVEVKKARLEEGAKINHLSYVGDAEVGAGANIGAGTITCNYDGVNKHLTQIGAGAFIGSNTALVAPVFVGAGAMVSAGATVTEDVPAEALALARSKQVNKPGLARKLRERLLALKAKRDL